MRRVNWTITEHQHRELKRLSKTTGLPISELVRRALDKFMGLTGEVAPVEEPVFEETPEEKEITA